MVVLPNGELAGQATLNKEEVILIVTALKVFIDDNKEFLEIQELGILPKPLCFSKDEISKFISQAENIIKKLSIR